MSKISPLSEVSGYSDLVSYYEKNKDRPWQEWLSFDTIFDKPGKQGLVGLLELKDDDEEHKRQYVFKLSQYINYLVQHESVVMQGLNELAPYCPHFCKLIGNILCHVNPRACKKGGNPFYIDTKYPIQKEVMLCEYLENTYKFYNYIRAEERIDEDILYSAVKQVLLAIAIAQRKKQFAHYDLHSFNVMMKKCNKDVVFLYVIDDQNQFAVPTHGHYPVIIDFGFSYIENMNDGPLWASMGHTDVGFMSDRFDWVADPKLFLVTVSYEIKQKRNTRKARRLRRIVRNLFYPLNIDWDSGWDQDDDRGASDYVLDILEDYNPGSRLFEEYEHYCIDLVQSLIILPLEEQNYSEIHKSYTIFITEFMKIEDQIASSFYNLYIFKGIVDAARYVRAAYMQEDTRIDALRAFRLRIHDRVMEVANFCNLKDIHYEKMLCSLLVLARGVEGVLYDVMVTKMAEKQQYYHKLPMQSVEQIYAGIDVNIPDEYIYNENTTVFVFDCVNETTDMMELSPDQAIAINELHSVCRGTALYDMYMGRSPL